MASSSKSSINSTIKVEIVDLTAEDDEKNISSQNIESEELDGSSDSEVSLDCFSLASSIPTDDKEKSLISETSSESTSSTVDLHSYDKENSDSSDIESEKSEFKTSIRKRKKHQKSKKSFNNCSAKEIAPSACNACSSSTITNNSVNFTASAPLVVINTFNLGMQPTENTEEKQNDSPTSVPEHKRVKKSILKDDALQNSNISQQEWAKNLENQIRGNILNLPNDNQDLPERTVLKCASSHKKLFVKSKDFKNKKEKKKNSYSSKPVTKIQEITLDSDSSDSVKTAESSKVETDTTVVEFDNEDNFPKENFFRNKSCTIGDASLNTFTSKIEKPSKNVNVVNDSKILSAEFFPVDCKFHISSDLPNAREITEKIIEKEVDLDTDISKKKLHQILQNVKMHENNARSLPIGMDSSDAESNVSGPTYDAGSSREITEKIIVKELDFCVERNENENLQYQEEKDSGESNLQPIVKGPNISNEQLYQILQIANVNANNAQILQIGIENSDEKSNAGSPIYDAGFGNTNMSSRLGLKDAEDYNFPIIVDVFGAIDKEKNDLTFHIDDEDQEHKDNSNIEIDEISRKNMSSKENILAEETVELCIREPEKVTESSTSKEIVSSLKSPEKQDSQRFYGNRVSARGIFLTENNPTKISRTIKIPKKKISKQNQNFLNPCPDQLNALTETPDINMDLIRNNSDRTLNRCVQSSTNIVANCHFQPLSRNKFIKENTAPLEVPVSVPPTSLLNNNMLVENFTARTTNYLDSSIVSSDQHAIISFPRSPLLSPNSSELSFDSFKTYKEPIIYPANSEFNIIPEKVAEVKNNVLSHSLDINYTASANFPSFGQPPCLTVSSHDLSKKSLNSFKSGMVPQIQVRNSVLNSRSDSASEVENKALSHASSSTPFACPAVFTFGISQKQSYLLPDNKCFIGTEVIETTSVLLQILKWDVDWFNDNEDPPSLLHGLKKVVRSYELFEDYYSTFFPLLMLETWHRLYTAWIDFKDKPPLLAQITSCSSKDDHFIIQSKVIFNKKKNKKLIFPDVGKIAVLNFVTESKEQVVKTFGYVIENTSTRFNHVIDTVVCSRLINQIGMDSADSLRKLTITFKVAFDLENIKVGQIMNIIVLGSLLFCLKQNDALLFVKNSQLEANILNPVKNGLPNLDLTRQEVDDEYVQGTLQDIIFSKSDPVILIKTDIKTSAVKVVPILLQTIKHGCIGMKVFLCARTPDELGEIASTLISQQDLKFVIFNKKRDTDERFKEYLLDEIVDTKVKRLKEIEGETTMLNDDMIVKIKATILEEYDVVLSLIKNCYDDVLAQTFSEKKYIGKMCCIIHEANYYTEPETLLPILHGISKLILIGLPSKKKHRVISKTACDFNFHQSFFQRAYELDLLANKL